MNNNDILRKSNEEKLNYFLKNNIKVHITKVNREFLNGFLIKKVSEGIYKIKENEYSKEVYLFLSEVFNIEQWKPLKFKEEKKNGT